MNNLLRLILVGGLVALVFLSIALGTARNTGALAAPAHLLLFVLAAVVYVLPIGLAVYRECTATLWIAVVNVLLGWTILGWFLAMGWAATGKTKGLPPIATPPPIHPLPGH